MVRPFRDNPVHISKSTKAMGRRFRRLTIKKYGRGKKFRNRFIEF